MQQSLLKRLVGTLVAVGALVWVGCGGDSGPSNPDETGSIQTTTTTTGDDLDADGYMVAVDGGTARAIGANGSTTFSSMSTGQHQVALSGLAANCSVTGNNPAAVSVSGGATAAASFTVVCEALTGFIQVSTTTTGEDLDPDGYTVTLDGGSDRSIGLNGVTTFTAVSTGSRQVELVGIADNCSVTGANPATAAVTAGETAQMGFDVACEPLPVGSLEVTTTVSNNFDPDGYQVFVGGTNRGSVEVNASALFDDLPAGMQEVELQNIAPNCTVDGDNPVSVGIPVGDTGTHTFAVTCASPPDGRIVYYGALASTRGYIVMNADGSGKILILECVNRQCRQPDWSPDGSKIAFSMGEPDFGEPWSIYTMNQDGSGLFRVTDSGYDHHPAWSPDGSKILFDHGILPCCDVSRSLHVVNPDGTGLTEIPRDNPMFREDDAGWSPDGTQIVFTAHAEGYTAPGIYLMDSAGGAATKISQDPPDCNGAGHKSWFDGHVGGRLDWSPDGTRILFTRSYELFSDGVPCVPGTEWDDLLTMDADGSDVAFLVEDPGRLLNDPSWSPDGSKIVYGDNGVALYVINADGTGEVTIAGGAAHPDWGP